MSHVYSARFHWTPRCCHINCNFSSCLLFNVKIVFGADAFLYLAPMQMEDILTILRNKVKKNSFNSSPDKLDTVTTQHFRRGVPRRKVLLSVTSDKCINSMTLPWVIWMLHFQQNFPLPTRHFEVFTSWNCSAPWWYHKRLASHNICLMQSVALLWILLPLCHKWQVLFLVWAIIIASKDPKMSKQGTAGKRKYIAFNTSTETWNNQEA